MLPSAIVRPSLSLALSASCSVQSGTLPIIVDDLSATVPAPICREATSEGRRDEVCRRWACDGRDVEASPWGGDPSTCTAGDLDAKAAERALRLVNVHRFLADVAPVVRVSAWTTPAQQCALIAHANAKLSHTPPPSWRCWSESAAEVSSVSLIANRSAPPAISAFIADPGNEQTMVHRRWLLSEEIWRIGLGSTDRYSCVVVDGRSLENGASQEGRPTTRRRGWVAWPPPGPVPFEVFRTERLDELGWTVQSATEDLDQATVEVASDGRQLAVHTTRLEPFQGSRSAVRFVPNGWKTMLGRSYAVSVRGSATIDFTVEPVPCD